MFHACMQAPSDAPCMQDDAQSSHLSVPATASSSEMPRLFFLLAFLILPSRNSSAPRVLSPPLRMNPAAAAREAVVPTRRRIRRSSSSVKELGEEEVLASSDSSLLCMGLLSSAAISVGPTARRIPAGRASHCTRLSSCKLPPAVPSLDLSALCGCELTMQKTHFENLGPAFGPQSLQLAIEHFCRIHGPTRSSIHVTPIHHAALHDAHAHCRRPASQAVEQAEPRGPIKLARGWLCGCGIQAQQGAALWQPGRGLRGPQAGPSLPGRLIGSQRPHGVLGVAPSPSPLTGRPMCQVLTAPLPPFALRDIPAHRAALTAALCFHSPCPLVLLSATPSSPFPRPAPAHPAQKFSVSKGILECMEELKQAELNPKWGKASTGLSRRNVFQGELRQVGIKSPEAIAKPSVRNDAAFLITVTLSTSLVAVVAGAVLPGDWGFFTSCEFEPSPALNPKP